MLLARGAATWGAQVCEEAGDYEGVREDLEAMMPGASAHGSFAMALVQREQEWASDCARCVCGPPAGLLLMPQQELLACMHACMLERY